MRPFDRRAEHVLVLAAVGLVIVVVYLLVRERG